jgi:hypothetical protein
MQVRLEVLGIIFHCIHSFALFAGSGPITFKGISLTVWTQFKQLFNQIRDEKGFNSEMCLHIAMEIRELGRKIKKKYDSRVL